MEKKNLSGVFVVMVISIIGVVSLLSFYGTEVDNAITGYTVKQPCRDSDEGIEPNEAGNVELDFAEPAGTFTNYFYDKCVDNNVVEYYCKGNDLKEITIPCQNGCNQGACISKPPSFFKKILKGLFKPSAVVTKPVVLKTLTPTLAKTQAETPKTQFPSEMPTANIKCKTIGLGQVAGSYYTNDGKLKSCPTGYGCLGTKCVPSQGTCRVSTGNTPYIAGHCTDFREIKLYDKVSYSKDTGNYQLSESICLKEIGRVEYCGYSVPIDCADGIELSRLQDNGRNVVTGYCKQLPPLGEVRCTDMDGNNPSTGEYVEFIKRQEVSGDSGRDVRRYRDTCTKGILNEYYCDFNGHVWRQNWLCDSCISGSEGDYCRDTTTAQEKVQVTY